ncbi:MAG: hypothetical protein JWN41_488 [Thermoleophilia bacterium]|nr:hypothetical protein [Thermoleophilia bacterium]
MSAEEHDIVARVTHGASSSTGALAAYLGQACGHVLVDARVIQQGYRFYAELGDEIPSFFNRRISTGTTNLAITLQSGFDPETAVRGPFASEDSWSTDPFDDCRTTADARAVIEADDYHASLWLAKVTIGFDLLEVAQIAEPLFIAKHPNEFRVITEELVALGIVLAHACPLCAD